MSIRYSSSPAPVQARGDTLKRMAEVRESLALKKKDVVPVTQPADNLPHAIPARVEKKNQTLRMEIDVLEKFKATGPGWQTRISAVLRDYADKYLT